MNTDDISFDSVEPTPQDWGFPAKPTFRELECWHRQEAYLEAYAKCGKIGVAAKAIGVTRWCVEKWQRTDQYGFRKRQEAAHKDFVEHLETKFENWMDEINTTYKLGILPG
jgi:hypothetical protein